MVPTPWHPLPCPPVGRARTARLLAGAAGSGGSAGDRNSRLPGWSRSIGAVEKHDAAEYERCDLYFPEMLKVIG